MTGGLLDPLTEPESDRLWWRVVRAMAATTDEIECLKLAPEDIRDTLYGAGCLQSYAGMLADLADLADTDLDTPHAAWAHLLDGTTPEGNTQWHDSDDPAPTRKTTWAQMAARVSLLRAARRVLSR